MGHDEDDQAGNRDRRSTVCIGDDDEIVREGIRSSLACTDDLCVVAEGGDVDDGLQVTLQTRPRVAIVGSKLPGGRGVDRVRSIRSRVPEVRCLALTFYPARGLLHEAAEAGAPGLVMKDVPRPFVLTAIRGAGAGRSVVDGHLGDTIEVTARPVPGARDPVADMAGQERRILELIVAGATNAKLAEALPLAEKTVRNPVANLLARLGVRNRTQAATMPVGLEGRRAA